MTFAPKFQITATISKSLMTVEIRAANNICNKWLEAGFVEASSEAKKNRGYFLGKKWRKLIK